MFPANPVGQFAVGCAILLAPALTTFSCYLTLPENENSRSSAWTSYLQSNRAFRLIVAITWCALCECFSPLGSVFWALAIPAFFIGVAEIAVINRRILSLRWTFSDICRLTFWATVSPLAPLLMVDRGLHELIYHRFWGAAWFPAAAATGLAGIVGLRTAQGFKLKKVKSGSALKRTFHLAKRAGVKIRNVYIVPSGRGELTNAFASAHSVGLTDNFGEYLDGVELDSVIAHELGHVQGRHTRKQHLATLGIVSVFATFASIIPSGSTAARAAFIFGSLLVILLFQYHVSRTHEYECDLNAVKLTQSPEAAIRALMALYEKTSTPAECGFIAQAFMTHPSLANRVKAIARFASMDPVRVVELLRPSARVLR